MTVMGYADEFHAVVVCGMEGLEFTLSYRLSARLRVAGYYAVCSIRYRLECG